MDQSEDTASIQTCADNSLEQLPQSRGLSPTVDTSGEFLVRIPECRPETQSLIYVVYLHSDKLIA